MTCHLFFSTQRIPKSLSEKSTLNKLRHGFPLHIIKYGFQDLTAFITTKISIANAITTNTDHTNSIPETIIIIIIKYTAQHLFVTK